MIDVSQTYTYRSSGIQAQSSSLGPRMVIAPVSGVTVDNGTIRFIIRLMILGCIAGRLCLGTPPALVNEEKGAKP